MIDNIIWVQEKPNLALLHPHRLSQTFVKIYSNLSQCAGQGPTQPPQFTKPLKNVVESVEGQTVHLEARLSPTGDSTMKVEWTVNGKPLKTGNNIMATS